MADPFSVASLSISESARVIQVIQVSFFRGDGEKTIMRRVTQYWTLDGVFLAEIDPCSDVGHGTI